MDAENGERKAEADQVETAAAKAPEEQTSPESPVKSDVFEEEAAVVDASSDIAENVEEEQMDQSEYRDDSSVENEPKIAPNLEDAERKDEHIYDTLEPGAAKKAASSCKTKQPPGLLSLPMDALHSVASFLTPTEWCEFGLLSKASSSVCHEIVRRVRMHGFRCATEIVTAWKWGQWEDARELAALYVSSGVPVYARCLGHSYHTIRWRMNVEAKETARHAEKHDGDVLPVESDGDLDAHGADPFFGNGRLDFRGREGYSPEATYLEEKSLFWMKRYVEKSGGRLSPFSSRWGLSSPAAAVVTAPEHQEIEEDAAPPPVQDGGNGSVNSPLPPAKPLPKQDVPTIHRIPLAVHQHLLDQHRLGECYVNDLEGQLAAPVVSLSADFFHPVARRASFSRQRGNQEETDSEVPWSVPGDESVVTDHAVAQPHEEVQVSNAALSDDGGAEEEAHGNDSVQMNLLQDPNAVENEPGDEDDDEDLGLPLPVPDAEELPFQPPPLPPQAPVPRLSSVVDCFELEVYSSSMNNASLLKAEGVDDSQELKRHLRSRFATYQRRLEGFLTLGDRAGFEECMLDFWDEFFPHTAGIHYHDQETAVPRISMLQKFLTKPCPQAIGVVQCEIERIKVTTKKGVSVKGRLFPTYEYRLFIKNLPLQNTASTPESASQQPRSDDFVRRDTVLMVAKNRGRKHAEASGVLPMSATSKKGSNNYYLYLPQQMDVDAHFNKVNDKLEKPARLEPNGASQEPVLVSDDAGSVLLGRLQSNFIGTEFQIFTPRVRKLPRWKPDELMPSLNQSSCFSPSEDELEYDSGTSSDHNSFRRSRFGRLSFHRRTPSSGDFPSSRSDSSPTILDRPAPVKRTLSSPEMQHGRQLRTNRRAVANEAQHPQSALYEEEDGAITYTANMLGSRPRVMDVCVPKVTPDGVVGSEWKRYLQQCDDTDDCRMLSCFKQLQQRRENSEHDTDAAAVQRDVDSDDDEEATPEDFGLMALQNRPPWWNAELGSFVLNFGGRVSVASVKNFQLCERSDQDKIMLQFGRIQGRHSFTMDFQHPLTAVQAFSIAISSLQSKISFG